MFSNFLISKAEVASVVVEWFNIQQWPLIARAS